MNKPETQCLFFGGQTEAHKLKEEIATLKQRVKDLTKEAKDASRAYDKTKSKVASLGIELGKARQEAGTNALQRERDSQKQRELESQNQRELESQKQRELESRKQKDMEQELEHLRSQAKASKRQKPWRNEPVQFEDIDDEEVPPPKKPKTTHNPQAAIEAAVQQYLERMLPFAAQGLPPPPAPSPAVPTGFQMPAMGAGQHYGFPGPSPAFMPSSNSSGGLGQAPMMPPWSTQALSGPYPTSAMPAWMSAGAGGPVSYPSHEHSRDIPLQTTSLPTVGTAGVTGTIGTSGTTLAFHSPSGAPFEARDPEKAAKQSAISQAAQMVAQIGTPEQQEAMRKFLETLGGQ